MEIDPITIIAPKTNGKNEIIIYKSLVTRRKIKK